MPSEKLRRLLKINMYVINFTKEKIVSFLLFMKNGNLN